MTEMVQFIDELKEQFLANLNSESVLDRKFLENSELLNILKNYTLIIAPTLTGKFLESFQNGLKQDIIEYIEDNNIVYSVETMCKIAFFRLQKISKKNYLEKVYSSDLTKLAVLTTQVSRIYDEYEIISAIA